LLKATDIAKNMIKAYGMSEKLGQISFDQDHQPLFLQNGQSAGPGDYSEETAREIDSEIRKIIDTQYARTTQLLRSKTQVLKKAAQALLEKETLSGEELRAIALPAESSGTNGGEVVMH